MALATEDIHHALTHAREVADFYKQLPTHLASKKTPDGLLAVCRTYIQKKVDIHVLDDKPVNKVRAHYESTAVGYNIYVRQQQAQEWRDFSACKELFHVVLDDPETTNFRTTAIFEHVQTVVTTLIPLDGNPCKSASSELLAEIAAVEFLFPYCDRRRAVTDKTPEILIANQYELPFPLIERYLSPYYMDLLQQFAPDIHPAPVATAVAAPVSH